METAVLSDLTLILELIGTAAFALTGVIVAVKKELDVLGVLVLGMTTAVGGGVLRDVLLGRVPPVMFTSPVYAGVAAAVSIVCFLAFYFFPNSMLPLVKRHDPTINVLDALGLGIFVVVGVRAAIGAGYGDNAFLSLFLGVMTGVGGGVLRDMLVGDIPTILVRRIYAIAAAAGAALYYALNRLGASETVALLSGVGVTLTLRLLSMIFHWNLPRVRMPKEERDEDASKQTEADCGRPKRKTDHGL